MSIALQMTHTCTIGNPASGTPARDADNQPIAADPTNTTGVMCRYRDLSQTEIIQLQIAGLDNVAGELLLPVSVSVELRSVVSAVTDRRGVVLHAGPSQVINITRRGGAVPRYYACTLQYLTGQGAP